MGPGVAGRADRDVGGAVGIREVESIPDPDRPVIAGRWPRHVDLARLAVELGPVAPGRVAPRARAVGHEAEPVDAATVVETRHVQGAVTLRDAGLQLDLGERIAPRRPAQDDLGDPPLLDRLRLRRPGGPGREDQAGGG